jgi:glucose/arabinose dehydrogenase
MHAPSIPTPTRRLRRPGRAASVAALGTLLALVGTAPAGASVSRHARQGEPAAPTAYVHGGATVSFSRLGGSHTFRQPVLVTHAGDGSGRRFVVEQGGIVRIVTASNVVLGTPLIDLRSLVSTGGERGLLGLAFHPDHERNGRFYVNYTDRAGDTIIASYRIVSTNRNVTYYGSRRVILRIDQPYANHNGGHLAFGPDGYLYIGTGDGGSAGDPGNRAQSTTSLLGKMLRINVNASQNGRNYAIPATNPYVNRTGYDEIWARGLRNPWRWSFDRATGDLWIADVGQNRYEEINVARRSQGGGRGANYGWRVMEGRHCYNPSSCDPARYTLPVMEYAHSAGRCSITGGFVYRGTRFTVLQNAYLFADFCSGEIWATRASSPGRFDLLATRPSNITSFGEDELGYIYVTQSNGQVYYIRAAAA